MAHDERRPPAQTGAPRRAPEDAIDSERKAREESEREERRRSKLAAHDLDNATDDVDEAERHGDHTPTQAWAEEGDERD